MELHKKRILFFCQYAAPYEGNFLLSLKTLEDELRRQFNAKCGYVFPQSAKEKSWFANFSMQHSTFLTNEAPSKSLQIIKEIISEFQPDIIHTHFDGYDQFVNKALGQLGKNCHQVWHMHNSLNYQRNPLKHIYQILLFFKHYSIPIFGGGKIGIIAVNRHELDFIRPYKFFSDCVEEVIPNGIDLNRLVRTEKENPTNNRPFTFLAYGGRNCQKRIDLLIQAGITLNKEKRTFNIVITKGTDTIEVVQKIFKGAIPNWLKLVDQTEKITELLSSVDCFVSTSIHETFSYAIAEASIFGIPVIQSDIEGTKWNSGNPSSFIFESENIDALASQMRHVMTIDKEELKRYCEITKKRNEKEYSLENWAQKVIAFYQKME